MAIRALILDFDGLMMNTEQTALESWRAVFRRCGLSLPAARWVEVMASTSDVPVLYDEVRASMGETFDYERIRAERLAMEYAQSDQLPLLPGVRELLDDASALGLRLGLASNSTHAWVEHHLDRLGLRSRFDVIKCVDDVANPKPAPDLYLLVMQELGVEASQTLAFEDSARGVRAAKAAGLLCVSVPNALTRMKPIPHADLTLPSLADRSLQEILTLLDLQVGA